MLKYLSILGFDPAKHHVQTEMLAGLTTFLTMSYVLAVNPIILSAAGMDKGAVFSATTIAAAVATLTMALYARCLSLWLQAWGLMHFFAYTLVVSMGYTWEQALAAVLIGGVVFIILTIFQGASGYCRRYPARPALFHLCGHRPVYYFHRTADWGVLVSQ